MTVAGHERPGLASSAAQTDKVTIVQPNNPVGRKRRRLIDQHDEHDRALAIRMSDTPNRKRFQASDKQHANTSNARPSLTSEGRHIHTSDEKQLPVSSEHHIHRSDNRQVSKPQRQQRLNSHEHPVPTSDNRQASTPQTKQHSPEPDKDYGALTRFTRLLDMLRFKAVEKLYEHVQGNAASE